MFIYDKPVGPKSHRYVHHSAPRWSFVDTMRVSCEVILREIYRDDVLMGRVVKINLHVSEVYRDQHRIGGCRYFDEAWALLLAHLGEMHGDLV